MPKKPTKKTAKKRRKRTKGQKRKPRKVAEVPEWLDPVQSMDPFNQALFREKMRNPNVKMIELAAMFSANRKTVRKRMAQPVFKQAIKLALAAKAKGVMAGLEEAAPEALTGLVKNFRAKDEGVQVRAQKAVLDYVIGPKNRHEAEVTAKLPIDDEQIEKMAKKIVEEDRKTK